MRLDDDHLLSGISASSDDGNSSRFEEFTGHVFLSFVTERMLCWRNLGALHLQGSDLAVLGIGVTVFPFLWMM